MFFSHLLHLIRIKITKITYVYFFVFNVFLYFYIGLVFAALRCVKELEKERIIIAVHPDECPS